MSALAPHVQPQPANLRRPQGIDDLIRERVWHCGEREAVIDFDRADRARFDAGLAGNPADEIARTNADTATANVLTGC